MLRLDYCEFYITNVCNLACPGCNRFNNYRFRGFQRWSDHAAEYAEWSKQIQISEIGILGGEPMLNTDFMSWVDGVATLWPLSRIKIVSNGFYLDRHPELYEYLKTNRKVHLWVGIHNPDHVDLIKQHIEQFLSGPVTYKPNRADPYKEYDLIVDQNNVIVKLEYNWWFHQGAVKNTGDSLTLHDSDPGRAHDICHMKYCHHFVRGKLYKCGVVALLPEFAEQHKLTLTATDQDLLNSYQPLTIHDTPERKKMFVENLKNSIDQCKFCPESYQGQKIHAQEKKLVFKR